MAIKLNNTEDKVLKCIFSEQCSKFGSDFFRIDKYGPTEFGAGYFIMERKPFEKKLKEK